MTKLTSVPKVDEPLAVLQRHMDDIVGQLAGSLHGTDEGQIKEEVNNLARAHEFRKAILTLQGVSPSVTQQALNDIGRS